MLKSTLKNYFRNLICVFVPMGIFYLVIIAAAVMFISDSVSIVITLANDIGKLTGDTIEANEELFRAYFEAAFANIDWNAGFFNTLREIFDTNWIETTIRGFIDTLGVSSAEFGEQIGSMVAEAANDIFARFIVAVSAIIISVGVGFAACLLTLRRGEKRTSLPKFILTYIAEALVVMLTFTLCSYLVTLWHASIIFAVILVTIIYSILALLVAFLLHGKGKLKLREVLNPIQMIKLSLFNLLPIVITALFLLIIYFIFGILICALVAVPFAIYAISIILTGADAFVIDKVESKTNRLKDTEVITDKI